MSAPPGDGTNGPRPGHHRHHDRRPVLLLRHRLHHCGRHRGRRPLGRPSKAAELDIAWTTRSAASSKVNEWAAMSGLGWGVPAVAALGVAIGAFIYWCVMVARKVGVLVLVTLAVFAGAGGGWEVASAGGRAGSRPPPPSSSPSC